jgi:hypothetical protein
MNSRWLAFAQKARGQLEIEVASSPLFHPFLFFSLSFFVIDYVASC